MQVEGVGVNSPEGKGFGAPLRENDVPGEAGEFLQEETAVDGGFPWGDVPGSEDRSLEGFEQDSLI